MEPITSAGVRAGAISLGLGLLATLTSLGVQAQAFIPVLTNSSTIPANGDLNPYGVAFVPWGFPDGGSISAGDVLVTNFNNSANAQGTGTTLVRLNPRGRIAPPGSAVVFFGSSLTGLSTAVGVLREGFVIVGNVPTTDGTVNTIGAGALQVIDRNGKLVATWTDPDFLDGPWDLALDDDGPFAHIFVSNVINGTVSRLDVTVTAYGLKLTRKVRLAFGYSVVPSAAAVILGPTGLAFDDQTDTLYVASTADNAVYSIAHASFASTAVARGALVFADPHLRGPLALRFAPNGHLLTANGDATPNADPEHPSEIVEFTTWGTFVHEYNVDASEGGAFGLDTVAERDAPFNYAVIDDVTNSLSVYRLPVN